MRQTVLTIVLVIALAATAFVWWRSFRTPPAPLAVEPAPEVQERLASYRAIQNMTPDFSLFSNPLFKALRSVEKAATTTVRAGRTNPFIPF